jgi:glycerophosphoryl diester phosphodiesterase
LALGLILVVGMMAADRQILVHGHRGARAVRPENTIAAFEYAIQAGVDVLELDLQLTKDKVPVVSHDPVLRPEICRGPEGAERAIPKMTVAELRQWDCGSLQAPGFPKQQAVPGARVPTLEDVLALANRGGFEFNIETKMPEEAELAPDPEEFARLVIAAIRDQGLEERVILQSFDFRTLHAAAKVAPEIRRSALYGSGGRDFVDVAREAGAPIVSPQFKLVTPEKVKRAHSAGLEVVPWTANDPETWERLIAAGVDAIITDDPACLIAYLARGE